MMGTSLFIFKFNFNFSYKIKRPHQKKRNNFYFTAVKATIKTHLAFNLLRILKKSQV
jgi:hypothetical protein